MNSAVVHCTLQGFIARLVVRADKGRRAVWTYQVHGDYNATVTSRSACCRAALRRVTAILYAAVWVSCTGTATGRYTYRCVATVERLLPRSSRSKEVYHDTIA